MGPIPADVRHQQRAGGKPREAAGLQTALLGARGCPCPCHLSPQAAGSFHSAWRRQAQTQAGIQGVLPVRSQRQRLVKSDHAAESIYSAVFSVSLDRESVRLQAEDCCTMMAVLLADDRSICSFWHHCQEQYNSGWCPVKCSLGKFTRQIRARALLDSKPLCTYLSKLTVNSNVGGLKHSLSSLWRFTAEHFQCIKKQGAKPWGIHIIFNSLSSEQILEQRSSNNLSNFHLVQN